MSSLFQEQVPCSLQTAARTHGPVRPAAHRIGDGRGRRGCATAGDRAGRAQRHPQRRQRVRRPFRLGLLSAEPAAPAAARERGRAQSRSTETRGVFVLSRKLNALRELADSLPEIPDLEEAYTDSLKELRSTVIKALDVMKVVCARNTNPLKMVISSADKFAECILLCVCLLGEVYRSIVRLTLLLL
jgi:hypothetical protein